MSGMFGMSSFLRQLKIPNIINQHYKTKMFFTLDYYSSTFSKDIVQNLLQTRYIVSLVNTESDIKPLYLSRSDVPTFTLGVIDVQ